MEVENMKNMVVLKNLPSNIVDEAIVILKPHIKLKSLNKAEKNKKRSKGNTKDNNKYIINEAEMVLSNYFSKIENEKKNNFKANKKIEMKCKRLKLISIILGVLFFITFFAKMN